MNYYRRFIGDYARDTKGLSLLQHGAYTLLLDYVYATEERISTESEAFRICSAVSGDEQSAVLEILSKFFKKTASGFTNSRFEKELKTRKNWCKWQKNHRDKNPDIAMTVRPMSSRSPLPSPSPLKEEEKVKIVSPKRAKTQFPTSFELSAQMRSFAVSRGLDPAGEFEAFSDHHQARGNAFTNWEAAWRTWCRNAVRFSGGPSGARQPSRADQRRDKGQEISQEVFGRTSGLVGALHSGVEGRSIARIGPGVPRNPPRHTGTDPA